MAIIIENMRVIKKGLRFLKYNFMRIANTAAPNPESRANKNHIILSLLLNDWLNNYRSKIKSKLKWCF